MKGAHFLGRLIFGGYFLYGGINHFLHTEQMAGYAAAHGVPQAPFLVMAAGALIIAGGALLILGLLPRVALALIILFLVPVTLMMHDFWIVTDPAQRMQEMINFTKNVALVGASLTLMALPVPWPWGLGALGRRGATGKPSDWSGISRPLTH
jgi:putative oxidoreductase